MRSLVTSGKGVAKIESKKLFIRQYKQKMKKKIKKYVKESYREW